MIFMISRQRSKQKLRIQQQEIALLSSRMQGEDLERSRIARELHDGVSVLLSAAKMNYSAMGKENPALAGTEAFREVGALLNQTVQEVRSISHNLVPSLLMHQSLPAAVQAFCELIRKGYNLHVELLAYGSFTGTDMEWNYAIYRMIQELIHNVIKHAEATEILIQLTLHDDKLHLTVEDNGIGFVAGKPVMGIGLQSLRQRVEKDARAAAFQLKAIDRHHCRNRDTGNNFLNQQCYNTMIRIAIVDDHPLLIKGLRSMLQHSEDIEITGTYHNGRSYLPVSGKYSLTCSCWIYRCRGNGR